MNYDALGGCAMRLRPRRWGIPCCDIHSTVRKNAERGVNDEMHQDANL